MKAILHTKYGPPEVLQLTEVETPVPKDNEVVIKIFATSVTSGDCNIRSLRFAPKLFWLPAKIQFGFFKPKIKILGAELAGEIEAVGKDVKRFKKGDPVFGLTGMGLGAHAQYVCLSQDAVLVTKPANVTFDEAATVPFGAHTALYFLKDLGYIQKGQKVLIYGASGGVGTFAVQLAKHFGAEVTGVCSTANVEMVKSLGADMVIDYTEEDFTKSGETYDIIFDTVGKAPLLRSKKSLKPKGVFLAAYIRPRDLFHMIWTPLLGRKKVKSGIAAERIEDFIFFKELMEAGKLKSIIDRRYPLEQAAEAFRYVEEGHKKGNVVITVEQ